MASRTARHRPTRFPRRAAGAIVLLALGASIGKAMGYGSIYTTERSQLERLVPQTA